MNMSKMLILMEFVTKLNNAITSASFSLVTLLIGWATLVETDDSNLSQGKLIEVN